MKALLILNFIVPFVMVLVGSLLKKRRHPYPGDRGAMKWKVDGSGYNTPRARKSRSHWDYAQAIAPEIFVKLGWRAFAAAAVCTLAGLFVPWQISLAVGYIIGFGMLFAAFYETEKAIKERFGD